MLTPVQRAVAEIIGRTVGQDFALGGGAALQIHGVVDRASRDIDAYATSHDPALYERAETLVVGALRELGYEVVVEKRLDWFRALTVADPRSGEKVGVDLGVMRRTAPPVDVPPLGLVLALPDLRSGKLDALLARRAGRDYSDIDVFLRSGVWTVAGIADDVAVRHPELTLADVREIFRSAGDVDDWEFREAGLDVAAAEAMARRFNDYADRLGAGSGTARGRPGWDAVGLSSRSDGRADQDCPGP